MGLTEIHRQTLGNYRKDMFFVLNEEKFACVAKFFE